MKKSIALLLCVLAFGPAAMAQQVLKIAINDASKAYQPAMTALYKEAGLGAEFITLPPERALKSVESGEVDADLGRVLGATAGYQNMMELTESLSEITLLAIVKKGSPITKVSAPDLKTYRVGLLRGTKMAESLMTKLGTEANVVNTTQQLFQMLTNDRLEIVLTTSATPIPSEFSAAISVLTPPVTTAKVVHVLGKKWAALGPKLDAALKTMKADGRWAKLLSAAN